MHEPSKTNGTRQEIMELREAAARAYNEGDIDTLVACWDDTESAYMLPNQPILKGKTAIRASYEAFFERFSAEIDYPGEKLDILGDWAIGRFASEVTVTPKAGGEPFQDVWKGLHIYRRQKDGSWKYRTVIGNSDNPLPEQ